MRNDGADNVIHETLNRNRTKISINIASLNINQGMRHKLKQILTHLHARAIDILAIQEPGDGLTEKELPPDWSVIGEPRQLGTMFIIRKSLRPLVHNIG